MKKITNKLAFTLIELLVVITIIGILATGATTVYTSQIQKARDSTRLTDVTALRWALEQAFQDMQEYPSTDNPATTPSSDDCTSDPSGKSNISCVVSMWYLNSLPSDPKKGQSGNSWALDYTYNVADLDWVTHQIYEISTWVESNWNRSWKASNNKDWWNDNNRIEMWVVGKSIHTCTKWTASCTWNSNKDKLDAIKSCAKPGWWPVLVRGPCWSTNIN